MEQETQTRQAPEAWVWKPHLWSLYCLFAERILGDLGEYRSILLASLPDPEPVSDSSLPLGVDPTSAYSMLNTPEDVKRFGKFYTPPPVVSHVLRRLGYPGAQDGPLLDPSCGTGAFLVEAAKRYLAANSRASWEELAREIRGIDIDPVAVLIARAGVLEAALDAGLNISGTPLSIDCRDALAPDTVTTGTLFEGLEEQDLVAYLVGNPPYGKVHSSDIRIAPYKHTVHGHANLYGLFLALAVSKLKEGGRLGFVLPRSFASGLYFKNLRRHQLNALRFDEVDVFGSRNGVFPGVLQETLLLLGTKSGELGATVIREPKDPSELGAEDRSRAAVVPAGKLSMGLRYDHALILPNSRYTGRARPMEPLPQLQGVMRAYKGLLVGP